MVAPTQKLLFKAAVEGTFIIGLKCHQRPKVVQRLRDEAHIDLTDVLPAYPMDDFLTAVRIAQDELLGGRQGPEAEKELGGNSFRGWAQTFIGRALTAVTRMLGPDRTMPRMANNMKGGVNFMDIVSEKLSPGHYRMTVSEVGGLPHFYAGLFEAGLSDSGARDVKVTVEHFDGHQTVYDVRWSVPT